MTYIDVTGPLRSINEARLEAKVAELEAQLGEATRRDLDETRRLIYGALAVGRTKHWELVGTLANALVHHSRVESDPYDVINRLVNVVEFEEGWDWLKALAETVTARLNGTAAE